MRRESLQSFSSNDGAAVAARDPASTLPLLFFEPVGFPFKHRRMVPVTLVPQPFGCRTQNLRVLLLLQQFHP